MEKGNEAAVATGAAVATAGAAAVGSAAGAAAQGASTGAGALVNPPPVAAGGAGPNVNATKPKKPQLPMSISTTNPDGSTRSVVRNPDGSVTVTNRDAAGNVVDTATHTKNPDGTTTSEWTDADGNTESDTYGSGISGTGPDGNRMDIWEDGDGNRVTDNYGSDGKLATSTWTGPESSGTTTYNPEGGGTTEWKGSDGSYGTETYDSDDAIWPTAETYHNPNTGVSREYSTQPNGDYTEYRGERRRSRNNRKPDDRAGWNRHPRSTRAPAISVTGRWTVRPSPTPTEA